jgi:hypothetical protein
MRPFPPTRFAAATSFFFAAVTPAVILAEQAPVAIEDAQNALVVVRPSPLRDSLSPAAHARAWAALDGEHDPLRSQQNAPFASTRANLLAEGNGDRRRAIEQSGLSAVDYNHFAAAWATDASTRARVEALLHGQ